jgi:AraC-like DNA-binding protein
MLSAMRVVERRVPAVLSPYVRSLAWYACDVPHARERIMPSGGMQLLVNADRDEFCDYDGTGTDASVRRVPGAIVQGPQFGPSIIDTKGQRSVVVVGFRLGGAVPFLPLPPSEVVSRLVGLDELWGRDGAVLHDRVRAAGSPELMLREVEAALLAQLSYSHQPDPGVVFAARELSRGVPVAAVVDQLGSTPKRFLRRFTNQVGLTPKRFGRVRRFQRALACVPRDRPADWAEVAASVGYFDQSHLVHEFRALAGVTPTAYRARTPQERNHMPV